MTSNSQARRRVSPLSEEGYVLLALLLTLALIAILAAVIVPSIAFEIRRDREEEMIHRGVQYSRAIQAYYRKFGRYPTKIEDLESANQMRFLRKRYKDPMNCQSTTCQDFRLLHFGEVKLFGSMGAPGINGAASLNNPTPFGSPATQPGSLNAGSTLPTSSAGLGGGGKAPAADNSGAPTDPDQNPALNTVSASPAQKDKDAGDQLSTQVFGGGPIVGVVSRSKKESIREFNHKRKYSEWQFIFDPATGAGLLMTPNQPPLQFGQQGMQNVNGQNSSGFGGGPGMTPSGSQNNPNPQPTGAPGTPNAPSDPPQQN